MEIKAEATEEGLVWMRDVDGEEMIMTPKEARLEMHNWQPWMRDRIAGAISEAKANARS